MFDFSQKKGHRVKPKYNSLVEDLISNSPYCLPNSFCDVSLENYAPII